MTGGVDRGSTANSLDNVYWVGGGSQTGKTTVVTALARRYGLRTYFTDDSMSKHGLASAPRQAPYLHMFKSISMDQRWVNRSPEVMFETFHWFRGELFEMIVEDLRRMPPGPPIIVEGIRLLPDLVRPLLHDSRHAVWLLPSRAWEAQQNKQAWRLASMTSDPSRAYSNIVLRERYYLDKLRHQTAELGLSTIEVKTDQPVHWLEDLLSRQFGLGGVGHGP